MTFLNSQSRRGDDDLPKPKRPKWLSVSLGLALAVMVLSSLLYSYVINLNQPPAEFEEPVTFVIEPGDSVKQVTEKLEEIGIVKSQHLLYYSIVLLNEPKGVIASTYYMTEPLTTFEIAELVTQGDFDSDLLRFTHIEGETNQQLAMQAVEFLPNFNQSRFMQNTSELEGKLFPDTYFIPASYDDEQLLNLLLSTYEEKIDPLREQINDSPLTEAEVIKLASIIEREANSEESKRNVASVLLNRLSINMPLQADASIEYDLDKPLSELTPADLKIDSPYNTYLYTGLTPTPIGNPGLEAIEAVINPANTDYLYYITGNDGNFYYADNYQQHLRNIENYLR